MNENPSFNWEKLQNTYYRSRELSNLEWPDTIKHKFNSNDAGKPLIFCTSLCFIAIFVDENIEIYDYKGSLIKIIPIRVVGKSQLIDIQFKERLGLNLVVVMEDSVRLIRNWDRLDIQVINLPIDVADTIWDYKSDIVILKSNQDIWKINWDENIFELLYKNKSTAYMSTVNTSTTNKKNTIHNSNSDDPLIPSYKLLTKNHWDVFQNDRIILLDINHVFEFDCNERKMIQHKKLHEWHILSVSNDGKICLFNYKYNKFRVYQNLLEDHLIEVTLDDNQLSPKYMKWLPNNLIGLIFDDEIKIYSNDGSYITFWYPDYIISVDSEVDGLKVITITNINLITPVMSSTVGIFRIGSTEPGAMLLDSWKLVPENPAKAIERLNHFNLRQAVDDCIDATRDEFDPDMQKLLLNAVVFGKNSLPYKSYDSTTFVETCKLMKLLNAFRLINIFLSEREYNFYGLEQIINILFLMNKYAVIIEIIEMTRERKLYPILFFNWCARKLKLSSDLEDDELLTIIQRQLEELPKGVKAPMSKIAQIALSEGRYTLCRDLSLLESDPVAKIMSLYSLDDDSVAIKEALNTDNPELIISLLLILKDKLSPAQLAKLLILDASDNQLYCYYNRHNLNFLMDFYGQTDRYLDLSYCIIEQGEKQGDINAILPQVKELFNKFTHKNSLEAYDEFLLSRKIQLNKFQELLTNIFGSDFTQYTLDETLYKLIEIKQDKYVKELLRTFKITERKYYQIKCRVLVQTERFDELLQLATSKKSPIGYEIFYRRLMDKGHKEEALKYIDMIPNLSAERKRQLIQDCQ